MEGVGELRQEEQEQGGEDSSLQELLGQLQELVECPVCYEVPAPGEQVPVCPNGHLTCRKCQRPTCPTCRAPVARGRSLLASRLLQLLHRPCRPCKPCPHLGCGGQVALEEYSEHLAACRHRQVACPGRDCTETRPLHLLLSHVLQNCSGSFEACLEERERYTELYVLHTFYRGNTKRAVWPTRVFFAHGQTFFLRVGREEGVYLASVVVQGGEQEAASYSVSIDLHTPERDLERCSPSDRLLGSAGYWPESGDTLSNIVRSNMK